MYGWDCKVGLQGMGADGFKRLQLLRLVGDGYTDIGTGTGTGTGSGTGTGTGRIAHSVTSMGLIGRRCGVRAHVASLGETFDVCSGAFCTPYTVLDVD